MSHRGNPRFDLLRDRKPLSPESGNWKLSNRQIRTSPSTRCPAATEFISQVCDGALPEVLNTQKHCVRSLADLSHGIDAGCLERVPDPRRKVNVFDRGIVAKLWCRMEESGHLPFAFSPANGFGDRTVPPRRPDPHLHETSRNP